MQVGYGAYTVLCCVLPVFVPSHTPWLGVKSVEPDEPVAL